MDHEHHCMTGPTLSPDPRAKALGDELMAWALSIDSTICEVQPDEQS